MQTNNEATAVAQKQTFTHLSKVNISQTLIYLKETQSYLQEQMARELFEQKTKEDFLESAESNYNTNGILTVFIEAISEFSNSNELGVGFFNKMQDYFEWADIYDTVEDAFTFYFLTVSVDIETYTDPKSKAALTSHYNDVKACYQEIILFIKNNKI